ncbi:nidogen isoform X2 [Daktulosphaira vitifoliae]|uniref:nidogen isoform X2 n=1 Tax=Daktulosphaira vitifoliae TaxID=58002 RepID=UPI0021AA76F0|nr:nidogen isoform X2 [Daktulosphaira vitifoliae]
MDRFGKRILVFTLFAVFGVSRSRQAIYPYGPSTGDSQLRIGYEVASPPVSLSVPIKFYNDTYDTVFINSNGLVSFNSEMPTFFNVPFPLDYPAMAAFYANIDLRGSGQVYYRESRDSRVLGQVNELVRRFYPRQSQFRAATAFIATWYQVGYYKKNADKTNTFQVVIFTDGFETFVLFEYPEPIQWVQSFSGIAETGLPDAKAQAGFSAADGRIHVLRGSGSDQIFNLDRWSNTDQPGLWLYRVGNISPNGNVEPPEFAGSIRPDEGLTCAVAGALCHNQASCVDYEQGDMCCICKHGFFGNGVTCIKDNVPVRVSGKASIDVNGIVVDEADLQAYVATTDGRVYMAISNIPPSLGYELQYLTVFSSVVSWLFALHSDNTYNGYQLTGGVVNYTADVTFPGTEHRITLHQRFFGLNSFDQLVMDTTLQGTTPPAPLPHAKYTIPPDTQQQFTLTSGRMLSYYTFRYKQDNSDFEQQVTVVQRFEFTQSCNKATKSLTTFLIRNSKAYTYFEEKVNIVRLVSTNNIYLPYENTQNPCNDGQIKCVANSTCIQDGITFRCECNLGFHSLSSSEAGCIDINECQERTDRCDPNAMCVNEVGSYSCQCRPGYQGNGYYCGPITSIPELTDTTEPQSNNIPNSVCESPNNISTCSCIQGYEIRMLSTDTNEFECVDVNECSISEVCHRDAYCTNYPGSYSCACNPGFTGDGLRCQPLGSKCRLEGDRFVGYGCQVQKTCSSNSCWCPTEYTDIGSYCVFSESILNTGVDNSSKSTSCIELKNCHANAQCIYITSQKQHSCQCYSGYEGDGYDCSPIELSCQKANICDMHATCEVNQRGQARCICNNGYEGDGIICTPSGECTADSNCDINERCMYDEASYIYSCTCIEGYHKYNNKCQPSRCPYECHTFASCIQFERNNYTCRCNDGYRGNGVSSCEKVDRGCTAISCPLNAECLNRGSTHKCSCRQGYKEIINNGQLSCVETCIVNNNICHPSAQCIYDNSGFYNCECQQGFIGNGFYCKENKKTSKGDIYLLVNQGMSTLHIPTVANKSNAGYPVNLQFDQTAIGLAVDCLEEQLYWSDITGQSIKTAKLNGSNAQEFIKTDAKSVEGLSVDWVHRKIYWTDSGMKRIMAAELVNGSQNLIIANNSLSNPRGIVVHPNRRKVFWTDWNRVNPKIEWSELDGTQREIFIQGPSVKLPNSIAIDWNTDEVCWADAGLKSIECVGIDSRLQRTAVANCSYPFGIAITRDNYYWSDWISEKIEFVAKNDKIKRESLFVPSVGNGKLYGIAAVTGRCP